MARLEIQDIRAGYGDLIVLWDVSLKVSEREIVSLIGSNGAGKTTTLKTIAGLIEARSGNLTFGGKNLARIPVERVVDSGIVYVPEGRGLFRDMTVLENLEMGSYSRHARTKFKDSLEQVYSLFPILKERSKQIAGTLSGGEAQMLAIGRGLMARPSLLMLDEPSAGISPILANQIFSALPKMRDAEGIAILLVEQDAVQALSLSDHGYVLENGRVSLEGEGSKLLENDYIKKAYLGM